jgi:pimeloyl-ACP methyl ester carboxylesterase
VTDLAYEGRGTTGPAFILVHGFPLDRRMWRHQVAALGELARVVAVDLPGVGGSPAPSTATFTMDAFGDAVVALADGLGFERFVLGGLSMGGYVALSLARRHPERLAGLVLMDTRAEGDTPEAAAGRHADAERILAEDRADFFIEKMKPSWLAPATFASRPELVAEIEAMARGFSPKSVAAILRGLAARRDQREVLRDVAVPTLVLCGQDDKITPPAGMHALAGSIPGARFARVPGGHFAPLEHPDEVNAELAAFLSRP